MRACGTAEVFCFFLPFLFVAKLIYSSLLSSFSGNIGLNLHQRRNSSVTLGASRSSMALKSRSTETSSTDSLSASPTQRPAGSTLASKPLRTSRSRSAVGPKTTLDVNNDSSESSSPSSLDTARKNRQKRRGSSGSSSSARRMSDIAHNRSMEPRDLQAARDRLSEGELRINALSSADFVECSDDAFAEHLNELKAPINSRNRSDSLARVKDAVNRSFILNDSFSRFNLAVSAGSSPSANSPSLSPNESPVSSPRTKTKSKSRTVTKAIDSLESGDLELWKKSLLDSRLLVVGALFQCAQEDEWLELAEHLVVIFEKNHKSIRYRKSSCF